MQRWNRPAPAQSTIQAATAGAGRRAAPAGMFDFTPLLLEKLWTDLPIACTGGFAIQFWTDAESLALI